MAKTRLDRKKAATHLANSYITTGVIALLLFYRKFFSNKKTN